MKRCFIECECGRLHHFSPMSTESVIRQVTSKRYLDLRKKRALAAIESLKRSGRKVPMTLEDVS